MANDHKWLPEIYYEEDAEGLTKGLPFVKIPEDKVMPSSVFICGLTDIDEEQKELTVHQFINMSYLKDNVDTDTLNKVRTALGLLPLENAIEEGKKINEKICNNIDET